MALNVDLALLRTFVAVVETRSLTGAALRVGRTQPAISQQLSRLEASTGRPLFNGDRRHLVLTADGETLLFFARRLLTIAEEAREHFDGPRIEGRVVLGVPDLYASYLLPKILNDFATAYPTIEVELRCRRSVYLQDALAAGELDVALVTRQPGAASGRLVRREPLIWVANKELRIEPDAEIPLALLPDGSVYREIALRSLMSMNRRWRIAAICDSIAGLQSAVLAGLAVAVYPHCARTSQVRLLSELDGFPALPRIDLVIQTRAARVPDAVAHLEHFISRELLASEPA